MKIHQISLPNYVAKAKTRHALVWDNCDIVTDHLVPLYRGERNVDKLGLSFDFGGHGPQPCAAKMNEFVWYEL